MERSLVRRLQREAQAEQRVHAVATRRYGRAVARRERLLRRAARALPVNTAAALGAAALTPLLPVDALLWSVTAVSGTLAVRAAMVLRRPPPVPAAPPPPAPRLPPPPPVTSSAWPCVLRLEAVREELRRLVPMVGPAGREAASEAWYAAAEADAALRWQAARLAAVEPHRGPDPELLRSLQDGVACQERLVTGLADLVAASADPMAGTPDAGAHQRLLDVADRLHGLADGLRALR